MLFCIGHSVFNYKLILNNCFWDMMWVSLTLVFIDSNIMGDKLLLNFGMKF